MRGVSRLENTASLRTLQQEVTIVNQQVAAFESDLAGRAALIASSTGLLDAVGRSDAAAVQSILLSLSARHGVGHLQAVDAKGGAVGAVQNYQAKGPLVQLPRMHSLGLLEINDTRLILVEEGWLWVTVRPLKTATGLVGALSVGQLVDGETVSKWNLGRPDPLLSIFDTQGNPLVTSSGSGQERPAAVLPLDGELWKQVKEGGSVLGQTVFGGQPYRVAYAALPVAGQTPAVYRVAISTADTQRLRNQMIVSALASVLVLMAAALAFTLFVGRRYVLRPIMELSSAAEQLSAGHLDVALPTTEAKDEIGRLTRTLSDMTARLRQTLKNLEQRNADLARQHSHLEAASFVAREAALLQNVDQALRETVNLISDRFGFYHAGVFLLDEERQFAVLRAASSAGGQKMLARGHRLRVGREGMVGYVAARAEPRMALDVGEDAVFFNNPDLPETRSEMSLPLIVQSGVIGVLDVQSTQRQAFSQDDVRVLQTLADQVAVAISNARLLQLAQERLEAEPRAYGELSRRAWREAAEAGVQQVARHDPHHLLAAPSEWHAEAAAAAARGETVLAQEAQSFTLATPIKVRGQVIGVLDARRFARSGDWSPDQLAFMESLAEQLGVALESARLYEDTQRRANQEKLLGTLAARMRESFDMEIVLKTAVQEMVQSLDLPEVTIRMAPAPKG